MKEAEQGETALVYNHNDFFFLKKMVLSSLADLNEKTDLVGTGQKKPSVIHTEAWLLPDQLGQYWELRGW